MMIIKAIIIISMIISNNNNKTPLDAPLPPLSTDYVDNKNNQADLGDEDGQFDQVNT